MIRTCLAVEGRLVDPYYNFIIGTACMLMNILMLVAFIDMTKELNVEADHINGDTSYNRLENLCPVIGVMNNENREWGDYRQVLGVIPRPSSLTEIEIVPVTVMPSR